MKGINIIKKLLKILISIIGIILGVIFYSATEDILFKYIAYSDTLSFFALVIFGILFGIIFYFLSDKVITIGEKAIKSISSEVEKIPLVDFIMGLIGIVVGIIIAYLLSSPIKDIPYAGIPLSILLYIFLAYLGFSIGVTKKEDLKKYIVEFFSNKEREVKTKAKDSGFKKNPDKSYQVTAKILDTSVIIDGRILEIIQTGFLEGVIIVPTFVLKELRHIADSENDLKRTKGRRGLDILNEIQNNSSVKVEIYDEDFDDADEVDVKLLKLAQKTGGAVITNDYNLNKVAQFQKVKVLNINDLANAVKTKLIAGENLKVSIIKEGKEPSQGIGYLDDGTMIVVENGKKMIGKDVDTVVTSVLQTAAGRMIFVKVV